MAESRPIEQHRAGAIRAALGLPLGLALSVALGLTWPASADPPPTMANCDLIPVADAELVTVETPLGDLTIELYSNVAPRTVANFLGYIQRGDYDDTVVHRLAFTLPPGPELPFVVQTGGFRSQGVFFEAIDTQDSVRNEPCISNVEGTIAMAKPGSDPNGATSQWFINMGDNSANLDSQNGGFTAFGQLVGDSLDVAHAIIDLTDKVPTEPIPPYLAAVTNDLWNFFHDSPLVSPLDIDGDHGCFDPDQSGVLLTEDPVSYTDWEPNEELGLAITLVSTACETGGAGAGGPSIPCDDPGRRVLLMDPDTGQFMIDVNAPFGLAEQTVSCAGIAASEASYATRLDDIAAQLDSKFVKMSYPAPEPSALASVAAALVTLASLRRRTRRR